MAVLNKIRQRSVFLIVIIALALFSFVLADVIRNGGMVSRKSENVIAVVNGEEIEREAFARQVEAYQQNMGPNTSTSQAVSVVWDMNVRRALLEQQFEELGIRVEEAQIKEMLRTELGNNPNFTNEAGVFDENRLREYLATIQTTSPQAYQQWLDFENSVAQRARQEIYFNLVRAGVAATLLEGEQAYRFANDKVDLSFVNLPYTLIPDDEVEITKSEIGEYIKAHPEMFTTEATRDIRYVHYSEVASSEDVAEVKAEIGALLEEKIEYNPVTETNDTLPGFGDVVDYESFVNENSDIRYVDQFLFKNQLNPANAEALFDLELGETFGPYKENGAWKISRVVGVEQIPDSARARHILVPFQGSPVGQGITRTKAEAEQLADSLAAVVREDEAEFAELALEFSADASNKEDAGNLGWFTPGTMVPAFNDFVFTAEEGAIGVVETRFGYHIIDIQEQTEEQRAIKLATIARNIEPSEKTINDLFAEVTKFELAAQEGDFAQLAQENDLELRPVMEIEQLEENIPGIGAQRAIVQWAFEEDVDEGDIKRFDVADGYVVAQVTGVHEEGLQSTEAASPTVIPILEKQEKAAMIIEQLSGDTLEAIAENFDTEVNTANAVNRENPVLPGAGTEPYVVGTAFALEEGDQSRPLSGENGVFIIEVLSKSPAPELDSYLPYAIRETVSRRAAIDAEVFEALKEAAEIEDNRARFY